MALSGIGAASRIHRNSSALNSFLPLVRSVLALRWSALLGALNSVPNLIGFSIKSFLNAYKNAARKGYYTSKRVDAVFPSQMGV